jgi:hypothetical protein
MTDIVRAHLHNQYRQIEFAAAGMRLVHSLATTRRAGIGAAMRRCCDQEAT